MSGKKPSTKTEKRTSKATGGGGAKVGDGANGGATAKGDGGAKGVAAGKGVAAAKGGSGAKARRKGSVRPDPKAKGSRRRSGVLVGAATLAVAAIVALVAIAQLSDDGPPAAGPETAGRSASGPAPGAANKPATGDRADRSATQRRGRESGAAGTTQRQRAARTRPWPSGRAAYTVVVHVSPSSREQALRYARRAAGLGYRAGVLRSDSFGSLVPGYWVSYAGVFSDPGAANRAAERVRRRDLAGRPYVRLIGPRLTSYSG